MNINIKSFICSILILLGTGYSSVTFAQESQTFNVTVDGINYRLYKSYQDYPVYDYTYEARICKSDAFDYKGNITIPNTIQYEGHSYLVKSMASEAFKDCVELTSIHLPDSLCYISDYAFENCTGLQTINIPNKVYNLSSYAFKNCSMLKAISLPDNMYDLGDETFDGCSSLKSIELPKKLNRIYSRCFSGCTSLSSITLPDSLSYISWSAFEGCSNLKKVYIHNLSTFCNITFEGSDSNPLSVADAELFLNNTKVTDLVIPNDITSIKQYAFNSCSSIKSVKIPESVKLIESYAFSSCKNLSKVYLPKILKRIGSWAFGNCNQLKETHIVDLAAFCNILFEGEIQDFYGEYNNVIFTGNPSNPLSNGSSLYLGDQLITELNIPNSVINIKDGLFGHCQSINSVTIGNNIKNIGSYAFSYCSNLKKVNLSNSLQLIKDHAFSNCTTLESIKLSSAMDSISSSCFENCTNLQKIYLTPNIKKIGNRAFYNCNALQDVYITDFEAFCNIEFSGHQWEGAWGEPIYDSEYSNPLDYGASLYLNNQLIEHLILPESMTMLKQFVFNNYKRLKSVTFPSKYKTINAGLFDHCDSLKIVNFSEGVDTIGYHAFANSDIDSIHIPSSVRYIGSHAFNYGRKNKTMKVHTNDLSAFLNITLQDTISSPINDNALLYVKGQMVKDLVIPQNVTEIKPYTFAHNRNFKSFKLHKGIKTIGKDAFSCEKEYRLNEWNWATVVRKTPSIEKVDIEDIAAFCNISFADSSSNPLYHNATLYVNGKIAENVNIPTTITAIKPFTFFGAQGINRITLHENVKSIGHSAFYGNSASVTLKSTTPPAIENEMTSGVMIVPAAALNKYLTTNKWKDWSDRIYPDNVAYTVANVKAQNNSSGIHRAVGEENLNNIFNLKVVGTINSYDILLIRNKMLRLRELDLSDASIVANNYPYYENYCTEDNAISPYAFYNINLTKIVLPKNIFTIDNHAFSGTNISELIVPEGVRHIGSNVCSNTNLRKLQLPSSLRIIDYEAFTSTNIEKLDLPEKILNIGSRAFESCSSLSEITFNKAKELTTISYNAFSGCFSLHRIDLPENLQSIESEAFSGCSNLQEVVFNKHLRYIGDNAFYNCYSLKSIKLPSSLRSISDYAFKYCNNLEEIRIPSSLKYVGQEAFSGCSNIKKVYTYTIEPTDIQQQTFSCWQTATLYVPKTSYYTYYYNTQWSQFTKLVEFDEPYDNFYLNGDYVLDDQTGRVDGTPDVEMNENSGIIVDGKEVQTTDSLELKHDGVNGGSIIADDNLHANKLNVNIRVSGNRWHFFCFPFDVPVANVTCKQSKEFVFRYYDGQIRAEQGFGGWKDFTGDTFEMGKGYIFQCAQDDTLNISLKNVKFNKLDKIKDLAAYISQNLQDASWNFTGNPFLSYYDIKDMDYNAPITVWDGNNYVAYNPKDDDYQLAPFEAFFVQKPTNNPSLNFAGMNMKTYHQSQKAMQAALAKRATMKTNPSRLLTNITLSNANSSDLTRIVFNDNSKATYEMECDAAKFFSNNCGSQIYTIDANQARYAINERPNEESAIALGYSAKTSGNYTISATRMDVPMLLRDEVKGVTFDLRLGNYSFTTDAGTFNHRFTLLKNGEPTSIEDLLEKTGVELSIQNGQLLVENSKDANICVFNMGGQQVASQQGDGHIALAKGNYIVKIGGLSVKVSMK